MLSGTASVRKSSAEQTLALPFRVPAQTWFTAQQAGDILGLAESTIEKLYDRGDLTGHSHNAGDNKRQHRRILRAALVAYAIRTADYTDDSLADALITSLAHLPPATLLRVANAAQRYLQQPIAG